MSQGTNVGLIKERNRTGMIDNTIHNGEGNGQIIYDSPQRNSTIRRRKKSPCAPLFLANEVSNSNFSLTVSLCINRIITMVFQ